MSEKVWSLDLAEDCTVNIVFTGHVTKEALDHLITFLEMSKQVIPSSSLSALVPTLVVQEVQQSPPRRGQPGSGRKSTDLQYALDYLQYQRTGRSPWRNPRAWKSYTGKHPPKPYVLQTAMALINYRQADGMLERKQAMDIDGDE